MTINLKVPDLSELRPRITVFGVGGAGCNAVNNMIRANLGGVEFVVANTDAQALAQSAAERRIQMGASITEGLGAGSRPEIGCAAAEESLAEIIDHLANSHMVFITAGMGGGTGTGGAPVIARAARDQGILTVGVVTKPFQFEGARRMRIAEAGVKELQQYVDTLLIIPNQNLFRIANERTTFADAFAMADQVLHSGVRGITDLMVMPGLINLDFADVRTVMNEMGKAMMGTGEAEGDTRAIDAAEAAINNPLLDEVSMKGARGVLINITGGMDLTLFEVDEAANRIRSEVDPDANIIVGSTFDDHLDGRMRVSVVATGIESQVVRTGPEQTDGAEIHIVPRAEGTTWRPKEAVAETKAQDEEDGGREAASVPGEVSRPRIAAALAEAEAADCGARRRQAAGPDEPARPWGSREAEPSGPRVLRIDELAADQEREREREREGQPAAPALFGRDDVVESPASRIVAERRQAPTRPPERMRERRAERTQRPDSLFPAGDDRDQLDIPAFLRRQAN